MRLIRIQQRFLRRKREEEMKMCQVMEAEILWDWQPDATVTNKQRCWQKRHIPAPQQRSGTKYCKLSERQMPETLGIRWERHSL